MKSPSASVSVQFSHLSCLTFCSPMDLSVPGFLVHHQLLELAQTHPSSCDAIQPSHPVICLQSFPVSGSFPRVSFSIQIIFNSLISLLPFCFLLFFKFRVSVFFCFWQCHAADGVLVPQAGIQLDT